ALRHTVRPRVIYNYIPLDDQDKYPAFIGQTEDGESAPLDDGVNRIIPRNIVTYSLTNNLTSKYRGDAKHSADESAEDEPAPQYKYNDFLRLKFEQNYNIRTARSNNRKHPFSPIRAELELFPRDYLSLKAETGYDPYDQNFVKRDLLATLRSPRGDELKIDYRYDKRKLDFTGTRLLDKNVQSIRTSAKLKLPYHLTAYGATEYNLQESQRIESSLGFLYEAQCWSLDVNYRDSENNGKAIAFRVSLHGLGGLGYTQGLGPEGE
ncbi:MAG: LPS assembly protein LptD, partial [Desulfosarcina sp.]|nr:LPS assembly protein LptD [Desulfobacterales bacterium]